MLSGLYLWTFDGYANIGGNLVPKAIMQGLRFNGDGTTFNPFGTVNIGGTIIIDATGAGRNLYGRSGLHGHASQSPTAQALTYTSDRVHSRFGSELRPESSGGGTGVGVGTAARCRSKALAFQLAAPADLLALNDDDRCDVIRLLKSSTGLARSIRAKPVYSRTTDL